jgi:hypothetical protein
VAGLAGEKAKRVALDLVDCKPLAHPALLQYLPKLGIDHDIAHQYPSQIDFEAPQSAWGYFALGHPAGEGLRHVMRCLGALFQLRSPDFADVFVKGQITSLLQNSHNCIVDL